MIGDCQRPWCTRNSLGMQVGVRIPDVVQRQMSLIRVSWCRAWEANIRGRISENSDATKIGKLGKYWAHNREHYYVLRTVQLVVTLRVNACNANSNGAELRNTIIGCVGFSHTHVRHAYNYMYCTLPLRSAIDSVHRPYILWPISLPVRADWTNAG